MNETIEIRGEITQADADAEVYAGIITITQEGKTYSYKLYTDLNVIRVTHNTPGMTGKHDFKYHQNMPGAVMHAFIRCAVAFHDHDIHVREEDPVA